MRYFTRTTIFQIFFLIGSVTNLVTAARIRGASSEYEDKYRQYQSLSPARPQSSETTRSGNNNNNNSSTAVKRKQGRLLRQNPKRHLKKKHDVSASPSPIPTKGVIQSSDNEDKSSSPSPLPTKGTNHAKSNRIHSIVKRTQDIQTRTVELPITRGSGRIPLDIADNDDRGDAISSSNGSNSRYQGILGRVDLRKEKNGNSNVIGVGIVPTPKYLDGDRVVMLVNIADAKINTVPTLGRDRDETKKVVFGDGDGRGSERTPVAATTIAKNTRNAVNQIPSNNSNNSSTNTTTRGSSKTGKQSSNEESHDSLKKSKALKSIKDEKKSKRFKRENNLKEDHKLTKQQR